MFPEGEFCTAVASSFGDEIIIQDAFLKVYKISIFSQPLLVKCGNPVVWHTTGLYT